MNHGTSHCYDKGCRLKACVHAKTDIVMRSQRKARQDRIVEDGRLVSPYAVHGTPGGYNNHGCRCLDCTEAIRIYGALRRSQGRK